MGTELSNNDATPADPKQWTRRHLRALRSKTALWLCQPARFQLIAAPPQQSPLSLVPGA